MVAVDMCDHTADAVTTTTDEDDGRVDVDDGGPNAPKKPKPTVSDHRNPAPPPPPVTLASDEGRTRLLRTLDDGNGEGHRHHHHDAVSAVFYTQTGRTLCGFATAAQMISSLMGMPPSMPGKCDSSIADGIVSAPVVLRDDDLLEEAAEAGVVSKEDVLKAGVTLDRFGKVLNLAARTHLPSRIRGDDAGGRTTTGINSPPNFTVTVVHSDTLTETSAKVDLMEALKDPSCRMAVNYHMSTAGQVPWGGHLSPLVAYDSESDSFLVMDVWPDTEPVWIGWSNLWASMLKVDESSGRPRGFAVLRVPDAEAGVV